MIVLGVVLLFLASAAALEYAYGATARRRQLRAERERPAVLEGGRSHLRD